MSDYDGGGGCFRCCFSFILTSGLTALFLWLSLRASKPTCSIQAFYVPALNASLNSTTNTTVYLDLKLDNQNKDKAVLYDAINLTLYYGSNRTHPVANLTLPAFKQGHGKNARRRHLLETHGVPWAEAKAAASQATAVFRLDLATSVRFKIVAWKTKRHKLRVGADIQVKQSGEKVRKKGIKLKSGAPELGCYRARMPLFSLLTALFLLILL